MKNNKLKVFISCAVLFSSLSIFGVSAVQDIDFMRFSVYHDRIAQGDSKQVARNRANVYLETYLNEYVVAMANGKTDDWANAHAEMIASGFSEGRATTVADMTVAMIKREHTPIWAFSYAVCCEQLVFLGTMPSETAHEMATAYTDRRTAGY
ncbi:MAG: hypothetical protein LBR79_00305 [Oscillospiraceae bacterium]|jgi:hypothetical protein|nr:hypothetical protein [Oscillospiraceae bacterium]